LNQDGILLQKGNKKYAFQDTFVWWLTCHL
jgi:hypothetical protein